MDSFPSGSEVLAFLISPDAKMEDCSFLHSSTNFSVFILTCQIICMTVLHLFVTIFVLTFLFPCFDFTACNLHSRISGRLGLEVIRHLMKYDCPAGYQPLNALNSNSLPVLIIHKHPKCHRTYDHIPQHAIPIRHLPEQKESEDRRKNNLRIIKNGNLPCRCIGVCSRNRKLSTRCQ